MPSRPRPTACPRFEQPPGRLIEREPAWLRLLEDALLHQVPQDAAQGLGLRSRRSGQVVDRDDACAQVLCNPERRDHVDAPRGAQVAEFPQVRRGGR